MNRLANLSLVGIASATQMYDLYDERPWDYEGLMKGLMAPIEMSIKYRDEWKSDPEDDYVPEIKEPIQEPIMEEIDAPDQNEVDSNDDTDMIQENLERLALNNLYGALVVFDTRT